MNTPIQDRALEHQRSRGKVINTHFAEEDRKEMVHFATTELIRMFDTMKDLRMDKDMWNEYIKEIIVELKKELNIYI